MADTQTTCIHFIADWRLAALAPALGWLAWSTSLCEEYRTQMIERRYPARS